MYFATSLGFFPSRCRCHPSSKLRTYCVAEAMGQGELVVHNPEQWDGDSARSSIIFGGNRSSNVVSANLLRKEAKDEEKERDRLHAGQKKRDVVRACIASIRETVRGVPLRLALINAMDNTEWAKGFTLSSCFVTPRVVLVFCPRSSRTILPVALTTLPSISSCIPFFKSALIFRNM
jgi:hypothetical protein